MSTDLIIGIARGNFSITSSVQGRKIVTASLTVVENLNNNTAAHSFKCMWYFTIITVENKFSLGVSICFFIVASPFLYRKKHWGGLVGGLAAVVLICLIVGYLCRTRKKNCKILEKWLRRIRARRAEQGMFSFVYNKCGITCSCVTPFQYFPVYVCFVISAVEIFLYCDSRTSGWIISPWSSSSWSFGPWSDLLRQSPTKFKE